MAATAAIPCPIHCLLADKLGAAGVALDTQVVAYDDAGGAFACRLWWLLRWLGHDRVAVLDGGIDRWLVQRDGRWRPIRRVRSPGGLEVDLRDGLLASSDAVLASLGQKRLLPDRRALPLSASVARMKPSIRWAGIFPARATASFRDNLDADGCFRPAGELRREFLALLADRSPAQAVMSCGSGVTACHNLLAMEVAGLPGARLYAGSWSEWCSDPARPVACQASAI
jgi:thiosulfate/3-mercaptopyruvate sulfurtransferase